MEISTMMVSVSTRPDWKAMNSGPKAQAGSEQLIQEARNEVATPERLTPNAEIDDMDGAMYFAFSPEEASASLELSSLRLQFQIFREALKNTHPELASVHFDFGLDQNGQIEIIDNAGKLSDQQKSELANLLSAYNGFGASISDLVSSMKQLVREERGNASGPLNSTDRSIGSLIDFGKILNSGDAMVEFKKQVTTSLGNALPAISETV
ncbi:hypothetical protein [Pseudomonas sp. UBA1879]|uniref:hypothetical protein n=1 Tax=Pseudomonas sp. UBA1879 TaxID=1947305 RepID=UPI0025DCE708|nr:hypothetical protein [Pseudomonas sp. UBA1879]